MTQIQVAKDFTMSRSWLNQVAVLAAVAAASLSASAWADNKGMRISGGSIRAAGGGSPGGSVSRGSVTPRPSGNFGGVSGGGFRPPTTSRVTPSAGGSFGGQVLNKGGSVLTKPPLSVTPKPLSPLGPKLPIVGGGVSGGGPKVNPIAPIVNTKGGGLNIKPILGGAVGGIAIGPKAPGVGPVIGPKGPGIVAGGGFLGGNSHCAPCNPFKPGCHPWWFCPAWVAPAPTPYYPVVYTEPIVIRVSVPAAPIVVPVAESTSDAPATPPAPGTSQPQATTPEEKLLQVPLGATLTLQATGLGEQAGQVIVQIEKIAMPALVSEWKPDSVTATLPTVAIAENIRGELLLMKADGQLASSVKVELTPALPPVTEETKLAGDPTGFNLPTSLNP
jgi:hypothetical protein